VASFTSHAIDFELHKIERQQKSLTRLWGDEVAK